MNASWKIAAKRLFALTPLCLLSSCVSLFKPNRQTSILVPGYFYATPSQENAPFDYDLEVREIGKDEFERARGIDVVQDRLTGRYFALSLMKVHRKTGDLVPFVFENLYDRSPEATYLPISYTDDNGFKLYPTESDESPCYSTYYCETKEVYDDLSYARVDMKFVPKWNPIPPADGLI